MIAGSIWLKGAVNALSNKELPVIATIESNDLHLCIYDLKDSLWVVVQAFQQTKIAVRLAFSPNDIISITGKEIKQDAVVLHLDTVIGIYKVEMQLPGKQEGLFHYIASLTPHAPLFIPWWPRDIIPLADNDVCEGHVHTQQKGYRSGLIYFSLDKPHAASVMYFQDLTSLSDYCAATKTVVADTVGGQWPDIGFALPPATEHPLPAGKEFIISDAYIVFNKDIPANEFAEAKQYIEFLALVYRYIKKPSTGYNDWLSIIEKTRHDLENNCGCWSYTKGSSYLNAYVSDYYTRPEIMVQLAVLLPLMDYMKWSKREIPLADNIKAILPSFYDEDIKSIARWLPAAEHKLSGKEEHKKPRVMDSWYLHHPLLNLARLADETGDETARKLFIDSVKYAVKVAQHVNYEWPVFYDIDTLEVIKAETKPGKGGEKDVGGIYAHVMMQAWELTNDVMYVDEAKKAAASLRDKSFTLLYQANNTAFASKAMLKLYKLTHDEFYLDMSYVCLANLFNNVMLWNCDYGFGKHHQTFFSIFPLKDAPYTAVYEEQEVFAAFHEYLSVAKEEQILPAVSMLTAEFIRFLIYRSGFYYPPCLPKEMLSEKQQSGELDTKLWIPLEDLRDGWELSGQVGQQVYGAGFAFNVVASHYYNIDDEFLIFIEYPSVDFKHTTGRISFVVQGLRDFKCRMLVIKQEKELPDCCVHAKLKGSNEQKEIEGKVINKNYREFLVNGDHEVIIEWKTI